ncbi:MAG: hypothetical protein ACYC6M_09175 [Terriglobales bacterium]
MAEPTRGLHRRALRVAVLTYLGLLMTLFSLRPLYNWDLVGYVGSVLAWETPQAAAVHARTYALLARELPHGAFSELIERLPYTRTVARDPEAFAEQLPFYRVKIGYVALLTGLRRLGVDLPRAVALVSSVSTGTSLWILFLWLESQLGSGRAAWITAAVGVSPPLLELGRLATPDALACLTVLSATWLLTLGRRSLAVGLGVAAVTVRPDTLVFIGLLAATWYCSPQRAGDRARAVSLAALALAVYWGENHWAQTYPWTVLFHHTFTGWLAYPRNFQGRVTPGTYLRAVAEELPRMQTSVVVLFAAWLGLVRGVGRRLKGWSHSNDATSPRYPEVILPATLAAVVLHFLLFPSLADRFFVPQCLLWLVCVAAMLAEGERERGSDAASIHSVRV